MRLELFFFSRSQRDFVIPSLTVGRSPGMTATRAPTLKENKAERFFFFATDNYLSRW